MSTGTRKGVRRGRVVALCCGSWLPTRLSGFSLKTACPWKHSQTTSSCRLKTETPINVGIVTSQVISTITHWSTEQKLKFKPRNTMAIWFRKEVPRGQARLPSTVAAIQFQGMCIKCWFFVRYLENQIDQHLNFKKQGRNTEHDDTTLFGQPAGLAPERP